jgi:osmotically inducible protein OsmC
VIDLAKVVYTAKAHVTGGRQHGHGRTDDGVLEVDIRPPGDDERGTNPEQLFAVGYAACFESALGVVARRQKVEAGDVEIDSEVDLVTTEDRAFTVAVRMDVKLPSVDDIEEAAELVRNAHQVCPYSNATRGNIDVKFRVNGSDL